MKSLPFDLAAGAGPPPRFGFSRPPDGAPFANQCLMSKQNPNQNHYKIGGRSQSDGPDRQHANANDDKQLLGQGQAGESSEHPASRRAKKK